jgi:hypothetical protein
VHPPSLGRVLSPDSSLAVPSRALPLMPALPNLHLRRSPTGSFFLDEVRSAALATTGTTISAGNKEHRDGKRGGTQMERPPPVPPSARSRTRMAGDMEEDLGALLSLYLQTACLWPISMGGADADGAHSWMYLLVSPPSFCRTRPRLRQQRVGPSWWSTSHSFC